MIKYQFNMTETIHFILTGGTIDSQYDGSKDTAVPAEKSNIPQFLKTIKLSQKIIFSEICMKDSRELNLKDRENILKAIKKSKSSKIIITHGTYTMPDTARYLEANLENNNKTIILTGSMIPLIGFTPSDAPFNLGYALAKIETLKKGIYVCMNGNIFKPSEVLKLIDEGRFSSVFTR
jgi:L-asparaginase